MTKVKDLVDVIVDNAFRLFPVDTERYELCGLLEDHLNETLKQRQLRLFEMRDPRAKEWHNNALGLIQRAVLVSLLRMNGVKLNASEETLARRLHETIGCMSLDEFCENAVLYGKEYYEITVLGKVSARLRKSNA